MVDLRITGADKLKQLGAEFKEAGAKDLRKGMLAEIRAENKPVIADIRASAREVLPRRGGLAADVGEAKFTTRTTLTGPRVGIRITGNSPRVQQQLERLNRGKLRHPLFGNRRHWYGQNVRAGWFDDPIRKDVEELRRRLIAIMDRYATNLGSH